MMNKTSLRLEVLESRQVMAAGSFEPPRMIESGSNPQQEIRVIVLNFDPEVPSEGNRKLRDVFSWNNPRDLAIQFIDDVEAASGDAVDIEIIEWRDLNEFPVFTDGFRHDADEYVRKRRAGGGGFVNTPADFYAIAEEHELADLVNENVIDEIWMFGDHYFNLLGEAWMAGPGSFFINGPTFPEFPVDRAVAGYGFNYERGVAEMLHNLGHRTENHIKRAYDNRWDVVDPTSHWDLFTANAGQTSRDEYGVGSVHFPFNGAADYDYSNTRAFPSYADDFVEHFPNQTYQTQTVGRDAWGDLGRGDWHRGYMQWFFGHIPRADGEMNGRQNNWYKYMFDFNSYESGTGRPRDNQVTMGGPPVLEPGATRYQFSVRYYDSEGIDVDTLDSRDVEVRCVDGTRLLADIVQVGEEWKTTAGTVRTVHYAFTPPGGSWDSNDSGLYTLKLLPAAVMDAAGNPVSSSVADFRVEIADPDSPEIPIAALIRSRDARVSATRSDIGGTASLFDGSRDSLYRSANINPAVVTLTFDEPYLFSGVELLVSHALGTNAYLWQVEIANSLDDLNSRTGTYRQLVERTRTPSDIFSRGIVSGQEVATHVRLTVQRLIGDNYVHINEWRLLGQRVLDGDANLDGEVDFADFLLLSANFGTGTTWLEGDFNRDGMVSFADFLLLSTNFGDKLS